MIELIITVALLLLIRLLGQKWNKVKTSSAGEKENKNHKPGSFIGKSTFILKPHKPKPEVDSSGKLDIEVPLEYKEDETDLPEEQEPEDLELHTDHSENITFEEMMAVVNEIGKQNSQPTAQTGKLLYENENTDWVEQLASSSEQNAKRISELIDLHMGSLEKNEKVEVADDEIKGFDIGEFV